MKYFAAVVVMILKHFQFPVVFKTTNDEPLKQDKTDTSSIVNKVQPPPTGGTEAPPTPQGEGPSADTSGGLSPQAAKQIQSTESLESLGKSIESYR